MKKKLNYHKVIFVCGILGCVICVVLYMMTQMNRIYNYDLPIAEYKVTYKNNDQVYNFNLKSFIDEDVRYVSVNDMYNMMVIMDKEAHVYIDENKSIMKCEFNKNLLVIYYAKDKIVYNNNCVELENNNEHIYVSHKNIYISVFLTEKTVLNNEKKLKFENKTAIIE